MIVKKGFLKTTLLIVVLSVVFWMGCLTVFGASAPNARGTVSESDGVNIRSSYSTTSSVVGGIPCGATVTITKEKYTNSTSYAASTRWYYVVSSYGNGYVRADLVDISYSSVSGKVTSGVNIRKGAGTNFVKVGSFSKGDTAKVRLKAVSYSGAEWYKILYEGYNRYVDASYVEMPKSVSNSNFADELEAFPSSYHRALKALHEKYPAWHFRAKNVGYTWKNALNAQMDDYSANTIPSNKPDGYKAVAQGTYDFSNHAYIGLDGSSWIAASRKAVAYYMDPRNWLDEINVFMFESLSYDPSSQHEDMVRDILSETAIPESYAATYMQAGEDYNISPVYLAAKSRLELGPYDYMVSGTKFTYNGKTYSGYYNAYNIGAADSAAGDAAKQGLVFAASGSSYLRPWKSLKLAIRGGAKFIAESFIGNQQHTLYYERFNVSNGLSCIGTHQYMTNTMAAATQANITYWNYEENQMLDTAFTFEIPVYKSMPTSKAGAPGKGNNNYYLDSLKVYQGSTRKSFTKGFSRFTSSYNLKTSVPYEVERVSVKAVANADDAKITISGNQNLKVGSNKITIKVKAASGLVKKYYVTLTRAKAKKVIAPELKVSNNSSTGKPVLKWTEGANADEYQVYRSTSKSGTYKRLKTTGKRTLTNISAEAGKIYYYKIRAVGTSGIVGKADSEIVMRTCDLPRPVIAISGKQSSGKNRLSWERIDGASKYEIYRATSRKGAYKLMYTVKGTTYTNTSAIAGRTYYYKVKAIFGGKAAANSAYSKVKYRTCDLPRPVVEISRSKTNGKPSLSWGKIEGAKNYQIYRATSKNGAYKLLYTTKNHRFTNTGAKEGVRYYYKVKAVSAKTKYANSAYSTKQSIVSR